MHVEIIETSPLEREVQIAVEAEKVDAECQKALNALKGRVKVKGFRPGKVPQRELQRRYGVSVRRDVVKNLIQSTLSDALRGDDLKRVLHVSPPEVVDDDGSGGFSYRFRAEVKPEVVPRGYLGLAIGAPPVEVTDEDLATELERLRKQHAIVEPIEDRDVAEAEDWVTISYRRLGDEGDDKPSDLSVDLTEETVPSGLKDAIVGLKVGDSAVARLEAPPGDEGDDEERPEPAEVELTLHGIKRRTLPDLDDELAEMVGDFETLDDLKAELDKQLRQHRENTRRRALRRQLEERLLEQADFELPPAYLASRLEDEVKSQLQRFTQRSDADAALVAQLREAVRPEVQKKVQLEFLLAAVGDRENVSVTEAEVDKAIEEMVRPAGQYAQSLRQLYRQPAHRAGLREQVRLDKTLDFLLSKATISEEAPGGAGEAASRVDPSSSADASESPSAPAESPGESEGD